MKVIEEEVVESGVLAETASEPSIAEDVRDIGAVNWPAFCSWLMQNFHGIEATIERCEGNACVTEFHDASLVFLAPRILANGVRALSIGVEINNQRRNLNVMGPQSLCLRSNAAGYPTLLEIGYPEGKVVLHFDGVIVPSPGYTANSWGE